MQLGPGREDVPSPTTWGARDTSRFDAVEHPAGGRASRQWKSLVGSPAWI
jgi:hypothetical protein